MFRKKRLGNCEGKVSQLQESYSKLRNDLDALNRILKEQDASIARELDLVKREVADVLFNLKNEVNRKLLEFRNEITSNVADRYFKTIEDMFRWNREFSFLEKYIQGDSKTLGDLRKAIVQPFLDTKMKMEDKERAYGIDNAIKTKGEALLEKRRELWDLKMKLGREEKDTKTVDAQLDLLDFIIGGVK